MIPYFRDLGELIERVWLGHSYNEEAFPKIALDALERNLPSEHTGVTDILNSVFDFPQGVRQPDGRDLFGEPPVLLFQAPRFYIEAIFWLSGTTAIHEHAFSGAFTVLAGSSVHSRWSFAPDRTINSRMLCGRLERVSTEILRPGAVRPICSGNRLIHQLFHLELPSVTIVVRSYQDPGHLPQYSYLPPGLAVDLEYRDGLRTRRLMLLDGMARNQIKGLQDYARKAIQSGDLEYIYHIFAMLTRRKIDNVLLNELYDLAHRYHGAIMNFFRQVCEEERRIRIVTKMRSNVSDPNARFLLALLMLMPDRDSIFETIRLQFPHLEPLAAIEECVEVMSGKETIGFDFNNVNRLIFRSLVEGLDIEGLFDRLQTEYRNDSLTENRDRLVSHATKLARSELFYPLLSKSPLQLEDNRVT